MMRPIDADDLIKAFEALDLVNCPYYTGDPKCKCNDIEPSEIPSREMCSECKYKWLASEVDE